MTYCTKPWARTPLTVYIFLYSYISTYCMTSSCGNIFISQFRAWVNISHQLISKACYSIIYLFDWDIIVWVHTVYQSYMYICMLWTWYGFNRRRPWQEVSRPILGHGQRIVSSIAAIFIMAPFCFHTIGLWTGTITYNVNINCNGCQIV